MTMPPTPPTSDDTVRPDRSLAGAIAVFLGGYLLLAAFSGSLGTVAAMLFAELAGRGGPQVPGALAVLYVLQFGFAIGVVAVGLLLAGRTAIGRLVGIGLVVVGSLATFTVMGLWVNGLLPLPGGRDGIPFQAVFTNAWFATVLVVGIAWLLARGARLGWLSLLGTLVLIPVPLMLAFANAEAGVIPIVMFLLSAVVGAGIIAAGRPARD